MATNGETNGVQLHAQPEVPIVDITPFTSDSTIEARKEAAKNLRAALEPNGSAGIKGYGIPQPLLDQAFAVAKALFDLPYESKMLAPHPEAPTPHRGYSGIGREQASAKTALEMDDEAKRKQMSSAKDFKETYEIGHPDNHIQYNIWLPEHVLPGFQEFTLSFQRELNKLAAAVLEALIWSLKLSTEEADNVKSLSTDLENQMRLAHYPSVPKEMLADQNMSRLGAHRDWSLFTMVFQDKNGGLEFHDKDTDTFVPATPIKGVLYLNVGDMFHRVSNGIYPSALHQVVIPGRDSGTASVARYSIPFFVSTSSDSIVAPQPSLVAECGKQVYEPVSFKEYTEAMFATTQLRE